MRPTERDQQARAAQPSTLAPLSACSELRPARAVRLALAWHLQELRAHVEGGSVLQPAHVGDEWARGTEARSLPSLVVLERVTRERDALVGVPYQLDGRDLLSADGAWSLWHQGEDVGEGVVHVFAAHAPQRDALARAVEDALSGNLDALQSIGLALPEAILPPPFQGLLTPDRFPRCRVALGGPSTPVDDALASSGGIWRADVPFVWQAPRFAARRRLSDLAAEVVVSVASSSEA